MKLSVIIPCLKRDEKVERAIRSIGRGVDGLELEVVVVEGEKPVGRARNIGLERATGDYVAWVDGDDEVTEDWLPTIAETLGRRPETDVLVMGAENVGWKGHRDFVWGVGDGAVSVKRLMTDLYRELNLGANLWLFVTRAALWQGVRFDEQVEIGEDYLALPVVLQKARTCVSLSRRLYRHRCDPESLMSVWTEAKARDEARIKDRRLADVVPAYRRAAIWGVGAAHYWTADLAALGGRTSEAAAQARRWIRRHGLVLARETLFGRWFTVRERMGWLVRFLCAGMNVWWPQKWVRRSRGSND